MKLGIHVIFMYMASICKVLAHSDFNCDIYGTSNTIGVAIGGSVDVTSRIINISAFIQLFK